MNCPCRKKKMTAIKKKLAAPKLCEAPLGFLTLESNCGPLTIWWTLRYFGRRIGMQRIVNDSHHSVKEGVYAICMAACLRSYGFGVRFFSDKDPRPHSVEKLCYARAKSIGLQICSAVSIQKILKQIDQGSLLIVLYNKDNGDAHFSPLTGFSKNYLKLAFEPSKKIRKQDFLKCWNNNKILRQCMIVSP
jgi:hypothetical protein